MANSLQIFPSEHPLAISAAVAVLQAGGLVVFPTDTVYGLAADLNQPAAIDRIYQAKERAANKSIAVLLAETEQLAQVTADLNPVAKKLAEQFWPGALTLIVTRRPELPANLSANQTIGVRIPDHPFARALMRITGPLAVSSANISGAGDSQTAADVLAQLAGRVDLVIDGGAAPGGVPSTVVDCTTVPVKILRQGAISAEEITACAG